MRSKLLPKSVWKDALGASKKPRRLHLLADDDGLFSCPVNICDSGLYETQRGCRKHVHNRHGWYYYFDVKPNVEHVLPQTTITKKAVKKSKRSNTKDMPMFNKDCLFDKTFKNWLCSPGGGSKGYVQASQVSCRLLKFLKFCCADCCPTWEIPNAVVDYCLGSIASISDFIDYLKDTWKVGYAGMIGYMNSISHALDFRRMDTGESSQLFIASEIYTERVKKTFSKKMRSEWNVLLSVEYLSKIDSWATLEDMQQVLPFNADKFTQVLLNASSGDNVIVPAHDLSFCTSYIISVLFIMVKASRPMTFQYLTVTMFNSIGKDGMIDQTNFKTQNKYGFDTIIFPSNVQVIVKGYITCIRKRLNPICDYLLISRNGTQLTRLSDIFGRAVFQAIGKYINPTRYRQIIETESAEILSIDEQKILSEDQKHTSLVAKVHYQKLRSRDVAEKGRNVMDKLRDGTKSQQTISSIENALITKQTDEPDFQIASTSFKNNKENDSDDEKTDTIIKPKEKRQKKVAFSSIEDTFLKSGLAKHGSSWKSILTDPEFKFHPTRKTATLFRRAKLCKFI